MKLTDFALPFVLSAAVHGLVLSRGDLIAPARADVINIPRAVSLNILTPTPKAPTAPEPAPIAPPIVQPEPSRRKVGPAKTPVNPSVEKIEKESGENTAPTRNPAPGPVEPKTAALLETSNTLLASRGPVNLPVLNTPEIIVPAKVTGLRKPEYPRASRRRGEEGTVVLMAEIDESGRLSIIRVVQSSGHLRLDRAAVRAVEQAGFIPEKVNETPVSSKKRFAFTFRLEDAD